MTNAPSADRSAGTARSDLVRRRFVQVGLWAPIPVVAIAVVIQLAALPRVPDPVAVHWDASGAVDGFGPAWTYPALTLLLGLGLPALFTGLGLIGSRAPRGGNHRFLAALSLATTVFVAMMATGLLLVQVGLTDAAAAPSALLPALAGVLLAVLAGIAGWFAQPASPAESPTVARSAPLALAAGERAVWMRTATMSRGAMWALAVVVLLVAGTGVAFVIAGEPTGWLLLALGLLLLVLVAATTTFHVTVDDGGLLVRSSVGIPRFRVPLADVAAAAAVTVDPMGEFGGWGLRLGAGRRFGVVLRAGDAIEVVRRDGRRFVVTVGDAATGAALLEALASRLQARP